VTDVIPDGLLKSWPWYVTGPLIGLFAPLLLVVGNRLFGVSSNLRHMCAPFASGIAYFRYDWRGLGGWNLAFALGILIGGGVAGIGFRNPEPVAIAAATRSALETLGVHSFSGLAPSDLFSWASLLTSRGLLLVVGGGFLVGFGTAYAGGCTSGHGISGIADLQPASFVALLGFFAGGIVGTFVLLPLILR
jgi:uncharacterized membrane protein YedE/YeeE